MKLTYGFANASRLRQIYLFSLLNKTGHRLLPVQAPSVIASNHLCHMKPSEQAASLLLKSIYLYLVSLTLSLSLSAFCRPLNVGGRSSGGNEYFHQIGPARQPRTDTRESRTFNAISVG